MKGIVNALAGFIFSARFVLYFALALIAACVVLLVTGHVGAALIAGYLGALFLVLVWNYCAAKLRHRAGDDRDG